MQSTFEMLCSLQSYKWNVQTRLIVPHSASHRKSTSRICCPAARTSASFWGYRLYARRARSLQDVESPEAV